MSHLVDALKAAQQARTTGTAAAGSETQAIVPRQVGSVIVAPRESASPRLGRKTATWLGGGTLLLVAASGTYLWWPRDMGSDPVPAAAVAPAPASRVLTAAAVLPPAGGEESSAAVGPERSGGSSNDTKAARKRSAKQDRPPVAAKPSSQRDESARIRVTPSSARYKLNPALARGYAALMAGKLDVANNEYLQVLNADPHNADALHGMAAISLRQGQTELAEGYYVRALQADPTDALAQVGLIGLRGQRDPAQAETRLKNLLAAQPNLPFAHVALGNLYASQNRWSEAQQAFFKAYVAEPGNPDTVFNLAVSLDHLRQPRLALQYYKQALVAAEKRSASFDRQQISARVRELQP